MVSRTCLQLAAVGMSLKPWSFIRKNNYLLSECIWALKDHLKEKKQCCCGAAIYANFPHHWSSLAATEFSEHTGWRWRYSVGARSCFHWKLHPPNQACPLLSTSNHGQTANTKCVNYLSPLVAIIIPPETKFRGGILDSPCSSVRPSVRPSVRLSVRPWVGVRMITLILFSGF